mmetsp:Transcript_30629/g.49115  ORF Transcript_30629/g.49115 Transcript_30629/m.49115 type:complete len:266 (+) Transcript_30629:147-944(+)
MSWVFDQAHSFLMVTKEHFIIEVLQDSLEWFVFFHLLYWVFRISSRVLFKTYNKLERDKRGYWCASMVSTFHAVLITVLSLRALYEDPRLAAGVDFFHTTPASLQTVRVFLGYITADLLLSIYYRARWSGWLANLIHHIALVVAWCLFVRSKGGHYFALVAHTCEITTPFVNQRWFMYEAGLKNAKVYFYNGLFMVLLWFLTRVAFYTSLGFKLFITRHQVMSLGILEGGTVFVCYFLGLMLQYFWFYKLMRGAIKAISSKSKVN